MATTLATPLVLDALNMALMTRRPRGVIHHSDQGSQLPSCTTSEISLAPLTNKLPPYLDGVMRAGGMRAKLCSQRLSFCFPKMVDRMLPTAPQNIIGTTIRTPVPPL